MLIYILPMVCAYYPCEPCFMVIFLTGPLIIQLLYSLACMMQAFCRFPLLARWCFTEKYKEV
jgi:hypothetical protein